MAIYVDELRSNKNFESCSSKFIAHIFTDGDISELHDFVKNFCGIKDKKWFDDRPDRKHYDIDLNEYYNALKNGAEIFNYGQSHRDFQSKHQTKAFFIPHVSGSLPSEQDILNIAEKYAINENKQINRIEIKRFMAGAKWMRDLLLGGNDR